MNTLLLLGGSPRCGKTIILNDILKKKPMIGISSDAIRAGVRYLNKNKRIDFTKDMVEDQLPWEILIGLIQRYDYQNIPLIVEGVVLTPARVKSLKLQNLKLRVAFVGFSTDAFIEQVIEHGKEVKDWVYDNIMEHEGSETNVREVLMNLQEESKKLQTEVRKCEYDFFLADDRSFNNFKEEVVNYLLR